MVIIQFPDGSEWSKANWIFGQLRNDVMKLFPQDPELRSPMDDAEAYGLLSLDATDGDLSHEMISKLICSFTEVARQTLDNRLGGWKETHPDDVPGQEMYRHAMSELLQYSQPA